MNWRIRAVGRGFIPGTMSIESMPALQGAEKGVLLDERPESMPQGLNSLRKKSFNGGITGRDFCRG